MLQSYDKGRRKSLSHWAQGIRHSFVMCMYEVTNVLVKLKGSTEGVFLVFVWVCCVELLCDWWWCSDAVAWDVRDSCWVHKIDRGMEEVSSLHIVTWLESEFACPLSAVSVDRDNVTHDTVSLQLVVVHFRNLKHPSTNHSDSVLVRLHHGLVSNQFGHPCDLH